MDRLPAAISHLLLRIILLNQDYLHIYVLPETQYCVAKKNVITTGTSPKMKFSNKRHSTTLGRDTEALISNGMDFLNKAREELQAGQAKFSIVSFWTAVEILIKVPLVHEHWSLACSGKKMERRKYLAGDFQSVTYDEACARLGDVLEMPLDKITADLFHKVKNHRNRVVHFYHTELTEGDQLRVLTEQADAWFALNKLMRDDWSPLLGQQLSQKIAEDESRMLRSNEFYAGAKFRHESVQEQLRAETEAGESIRTCAVCGYVAALKQMLVPEIDLYDETCFVCDVQTICLDAECSGCGKATRLETGDSDFKCNSCGYQSSRYDAISQVSVNARDEADAAGCSFCLRPNSVCQYYGEYICTGCFNSHELLEKCGYCSHWCADIPSDSVRVGCAFCNSLREKRAQRPSE
ncbi:MULTISPECIES: hsdR [Pectobacterium]|uniref:hsdR n=1 Tax=Pectobacterium TaxID=122277 RepID=UPI001CF2D3A8|nr:hsdR [Pectobacterium polaris]MCA6941837.1 hsdR [Pectobacterium polaris]MCA6957679.1 hsdR [Pectobacterium polaris]